MYNPSAEGVIIFVAVATLLILAMAVFISIIVYRYQQRQNIHLKNIQALNIAHDNSLLQTRLEIQEQTLQHMAREIHDNIGLTLTLAKLNLNTIELNEKLMTQDKLNNAIALLSKSIDDLSVLGKSMNADYIASNGFLKTVDNALTNIQKTGMHTELVITGEPIFLDSQKELVLFRIVQEAFNNIMKHACATDLNITLHYNDQSLDILVVDNGKGLPQDLTRIKKNGSGLANMQQRAKTINGKCLIQNNNTKGTTVIINMPY